MRFLLRLEYEIDAVTMRIEPKPTNERAYIRYGKEAKLRAIADASG